MVGTAPVLDMSSARIGVNVGEREVNKPAGQRPPDVAADAAGARLAERGHRHLAGHPLLSGRAVEQNAIRYDGIEGSAIIDAAPGNLNGEITTPFKLQASLENVQEFRVESSGYPAEFGTGTGGQVSVITKSGGNDVPRRRCSSTCAARSSTRRTTSTRPPGLPKVAAEAEPVRRLGRRPDRQGQGLLLRQLRRLPAERRHQLRRGGAERRRLGARRARHRGLRPGFSRPARSFCRARRRTRTSTSRSSRRRRT